MDVAHNYQVDVVQLGDEAAVLVAGEIDLAAVDALTAAIDRARRDRRRLVIDMSGVTFIDSAGLVVLFRTFRALGQVKEGLVLRSVRPAVLRTLQMTGLHDLVTVEPSGGARTGPAAGTG